MPGRNRTGPQGEGQATGRMDGGCVPRGTDQTGRTGRGSTGTGVRAGGQGRSLRKQPGGGVGRRRMVGGGSSMQGGASRQNGADRPIADIGSRDE